MLEANTQMGVLNFDDLQQQSQQNQMENYNLWFNYAPYFQYNHDLSLFPWQYDPFPQFQYHSNQFFYQEVLILDENSNDLAATKSQSNVEIIQIPISTKEQREPKVSKEKKVYKKRKQDANYLNKCQKDDRNLNSIVLRNFVNFVNGHPDILKKIEEIIEKKKLSISASSYREKFRKSLPPHQSYVGVARVKNFIEMDKQNGDFKLLTLILLRRFIYVDFFTVLINSNKVSRSAKEKELKHGKTFWKDFISQCA